MTRIEAKPVGAVDVDRSNETTAAGIPWYAFNQHRHVVRQRWPSIWSLPIIRDPFDLLHSLDTEPLTVLDVGATCRSREADVKRRWLSATYRSLDLDRSMHHDYYAFAEIDQDFDLVCCLEVLEHVRPETALELVDACRDVTTPGGLCLVSVPNVMVPGVQLEFTHQTAFHYADLGGILTWSGFEIVAAARLFTRPWTRLLAHRLAMPLHRLMAVDFCQTVNFLARRMN